MLGRCNRGQGTSRGQLTANQSMICPNFRRVTDTRFAARSSKKGGSLWAAREMAGIVRPVALA